jgi:hypothetical protein
MKKVMIFFFALLLSVMEAQAGGGAAGEAPEWFLYPPEGTYAGVSLPLEDTVLAEQQAVCVALLSYMLQHHSTMRLNQMANSISDGQVEELRGIKALQMVLPDKYRVTRKAKNKFGEVFVALQEVSFSGTAGAIVRFEQAYEQKGEESHNSLEEFIMKTAAFEAYIKVADTGKKTIVTVSVENAKSKEHLSNARYRYISTVAEKPYDTHTIATTGYPMEYSLGIAYPMSLLGAFFQGASPSTTDEQKRAGTPLQQVSIHNNMLYVSVYKNRK